MVFVTKALKESGKHKKQKRINRNNFLLGLIFLQISDALRDLVPFVHFKKCEKTHGGIYTFFKLYKWYQIAQNIIIVKHANEYVHYA